MTTSVISDMTTLVLRDILKISELFLYRELEESLNVVGLVEVVVPWRLLNANGRPEAIGDYSGRN
ncbi:MAG TPA: hypothetical protein VF020_16205 [Chthoniobacterales bacterium]